VFHPKIKKYVPKENLHYENGKIALISVTASLPNNVNQLHCWSTIDLLCNFKHADG